MLVKGKSNLCLVLNLIVLYFWFLFVVDFWFLGLSIIKECVFIFCIYFYCVCIVSNLVNLCFFDFNLSNKIVKEIC